MPKMDNEQRKEFLISSVAIDEATGCWIWQKSSNRQGYGRAYLNRVPWFAHRASYHVFIGPIPEGLTVDHLCFNPPCINPEHLRLLANADNARNRRAVLADVCVAGHPRTPENVTRYGGKRQCRVCRNLKRRKPDGRIAARAARERVSA